MDAKREEMVQELYESWTRTEVSFRMKLLPYLKGIELGLPQLEILFALNHSDNKKASIKELVQLLHKTSSAITQLVEGLEAKGYVERQHSTEDRRVVYVRMKEAGEEKFALFNTSLIESIGSLTNSLDDDEIAEYVRISNKIAEQI